MSMMKYVLCIAGIAQSNALRMQKTTGYVPQYPAPSVIDPELFEQGVNDRGEMIGTQGDGSCLIHALGGKVCKDWNMFEVENILETRQDIAKAFEQAMNCGDIKGPSLLQLDIFGFGYVVDEKYGMTPEAMLRELKAPRGKLGAEVLSFVAWFFKVNVTFIKARTNEKAPLNKNVVVFKYGLRKPMIYVKFVHDGHWERVVKKSEKEPVQQGLVDNVLQKDLENLQKQKQTLEVLEEEGWDVKKNLEEVERAISFLLQACLPKEVEKREVENFEEMEPVQQELVDDALPKHYQLQNLENEMKNLKFLKSKGDDVEKQLKKLAQDMETAKRFLQASQPQKAAEKREVENLKEKQPVRQGLVDNVLQKDLDDLAEQVFEEHRKMKDLESQSQSLEAILSCEPENQEAAQQFEEVQKQILYQKHVLDMLTREVLKHVK